MEVMIPDFHFSSARTSPQVSAPSSPRCSSQLYYYSAPTSPTYISQFYHNFDRFQTETAAAEASGGRVPFAWEETPGTPKSPAKKTVTDNFDFAFDVNDDWETESLSAAELFDGGMIKPLKPPPRLQLPDTARISEKKASPRSKKEKPITDSDPFAIAARKATEAPLPERGREKITNLANSSSRRASRSLSPFRDTRSSSIGQKKWSFKDLFLFRSASEGRAAEKDPLKKYTAAYGCSNDGSGSGSGSRGRRRQVSAHEGYYKVNRAVSEDLKKKTFLPYKQGILGRFSFNPAVHALSNGFGFSRR